jgi:hypothetical protein
MGCSGIHAAERGAAVSRGIDTYRGSTIMIQMMMSTIGGSLTARNAPNARPQQALMLRKVAGFAILSSGLMVMLSQALQHALGG